MLSWIRPCIRAALHTRGAPSYRSLSTLSPQTDHPDSEPRKQPTLNFKTIEYRTKVPQSPVPAPEFVSRRITIDADTIKLLERLSLVNLDSKEAVRELEESIAFASRILDIDTEHVRPLYTVLEDTPLQLRPDRVTDGDCREAILANAQLTEEEYFVSPPGNIPLEQNHNEAAK